MHQLDESRRQAVQEHPREILALPPPPCSEPAESCDLRNCHFLASLYSRVCASYLPRVGGGHLQNRLRPTGVIVLIVCYCVYYGLTSSLGFITGIVLFAHTFLVPCLLPICTNYTIAEVDQFPAITAMMTVRRRRRAPILAVIPWKRFSSDIESIRDVFKVRWPESATSSSILKHINLHPLCSIEI